MNALDQFLATVTDEFGNNIDFSNIENEGFNGIICFGEKSAEISISEESFIELQSDLSESDKTLLNAFVEYTQSFMRDQKFFIHSI